MGEKENLILSFQQAASADGFKFERYGLDGKNGEETESVMSKCVVKKRLIYKYKNATKLVQRLLGITIDGKAGKDTDAAIRKFQKEHNLVIDRTVGLCTLEKLLGIK